MAAQDPGITADGTKIADHVYDDVPGHVDDDGAIVADLEASRRAVAVVTKLAGPSDELFKQWALVQVCVSGVLIMWANERAYECASRSR